MPHTHRPPARHRTFAAKEPLKQATQAVENIGNGVQASNDDAVEAPTSTLISEPSIASKHVKKLPGQRNGSRGNANERRLMNSNPDAGNEWGFTNGNRMQPGYLHAVLKAHDPDDIPSPDFSVSPGMLR